ncbi:MAG: DUF4056 domain-containing protein, partial [Saprospiraceae bacterium]|nr:DUF4056 domain-containing protein [Saprospiraceae bacterium]
SDLKMVGVPLLKFTQITSTEMLGHHVYLGDQSEGNGIIYTTRGGFIDLGHVRDQADWTAFLFVQLQNVVPDSIYNLRLPFEGGVKMLTIKADPELSQDDYIKLAGSMAYDLSVWHEIATWFGASSVPLVPERYSSFSIEDAYSNLLGVHIGMEAIVSDLPYEAAVSELLQKELVEMGAVSSTEATREAMESVHEIWWSRARKLPTRKVLLARELDVYEQVVPWLVPGREEFQLPHILEVPSLSNKGQNLHDYYAFTVRVNRKFPFRRMFPDREDRKITQRDFGLLMQRIKWELANKDRSKGEEKIKYSPAVDHVISGE